MKFFCLKKSLVFRILLLLLPVCCSETLSAQNDALGGWNIFNYNYYFNKKVFLYGEVQVRSQQLADDFYYHELKLGAGYNITDKSAVFLGLGNYKTYTFPGNFEKPVTANEYRIWQQFIMVNYVSRIKFEHRYRVEERWINSDFFMRFRYRLFAFLPLNHATLTAKTVYIPVYDEVFFTNKEPYFIRNRIFGGLGYMFTKSISLHTGFIRQFDYRTSDGGSGKNFIQVQFVINGGHPGKEPQHSNAD